MPSLIIDCPSCSRKLRVPDGLIGTAVKCPTCEHIFEATAAQDSSVASRVPDAAYPPSATGDEPPAPFSPEQQRPPRPDSQLRACPHCGEQIEKDATRCPFCGDELEADEEADERPWEESRQFQGRRDAEPHRGTLILVLGITSLVMATFGTCSWGLGGVVGMPLGIAAWVMGRRDLIKMRQNLMDRAGEGLTQAGWIIGIIGTVLGSLCTLGFLVFVGFVFTMGANVRRVPPPPVPPPAPIRPPPAPPPGEPGNKAALHSVPQGLQDYLPTVHA
jgi:predicted Zn finger-like uncharacterized protein